MVDDLLPCVNALINEILYFCVCMRYVELLLLFLSESLSSNEFGMMVMHEHSSEMIVYSLEHLP